MYNSDLLERMTIFNLNIRIWNFLGIFGKNNLIRIVAYLLFPVLNNLAQLCFAFVNWSNFNELIINLFMMVILFNTILRLISVQRNEQKFIGLLNIVAIWLEELQQKRDLAGQLIFKKIAKRADFLSKFALCAASFGAFMTVLMPIFLQRRVHPHPVHLPYIDVLQSPIYEIIYTIQFLVIMPFIITFYCIYLNFFICWLLFGIGALQHLCHKLTSIGNYDTEFEKEIELRNCIIYHQRIINFVMHLNELVSFVCLIEFVMFSVMFCVLLLLFTTSDNLMEKVIAAIYILSIIYGLFLPYWFTNDISVQSLYIADAAYGVDWTVSSQTFRSSLIIMIARSQTALELTAGGIYPMNLKTFQALLNASYSYFTLLLGVNHK